MMLVQGKNAAAPESKQMQHYCMGGAASRTSGGRAISIRFLKC